MRQASTKSRLIGKWRLIDMELWDQEFIDLVEPGYIEFKPARHGTMIFGAVKLDLDWEAGEEGRLDFTFEGFDEMDEVSGRGWVKVVDGQILGQVKFYQGDASGFLAERWTKKQHHGEERGRE